MVEKAKKNKKSEDVLTAFGVLAFGRMQMPVSKTRDSLDPATTFSNSPNP